MPEISRFFKVIMTMYGDEQSSPNFHVQYNEQKVKIAITDLGLLAGKSSPRVRGTEWARLHQTGLMADGTLACQKFEFKKTPHLGVIYVSH